MKIDYAGARSVRDITGLSALLNVKGVCLDVTSASDVAAAVETITREHRGLYGLGTTLAFSSLRR